MSTKPYNNSIEQTPRSAANPDLEWASGRARIIEEFYRRCSSQSRYPADKGSINFFLLKTIGQIWGRPIPCEGE